MPSQISAASPGELFNVIRLSGGMTRQQLLTHTGMARSTLYGRLDQLTNAGLICEAGVTDSTGGRPASLLAFDDSERAVLTIDVGHHRAAVALYTASGEVLGELTCLRTAAEPLEDLADRVEGLVDQLLAERPGKRLIGLGLAIPTPVNVHTGRRLPSVAMPEASYPLSERLAQRYGVPVAVENDARAFAIGAAAEVPPMDPDGVLLGVKYSTGIGIGLLTGGHIMRGTSGAAGDLGHLQITPGEGPTCTCGRRGCLAAYASGRALVKEFARDDISDVGDLVCSYDQGDVQVMEAVHHAATILGTQVGGLVQVSNPQYVVFGGFLGGRPTIADRVIESIKLQVSDRISTAADYRVVGGDDTTAAGLLALVMELALSPEAINTLVGANA
ncbi:ROK family protein [Luteococcus sp. H138]|uniref:ROK family protein n=1 Tax=unclassified Luteococcus TaxID=2639923 RepID=UPI00313AFA22